MKIVIAGIVASVLLFPQATEAGVAQRVIYPKELRGVWDVAPYECFGSNRQISDRMFEIRAKSLHGYENTDTLLSIERISASPRTWRVVAISNVAPIDIQGDAEIYILNGNKLTISNGSTSETFIRCK